MAAVRRRRQAARLSAAVAGVLVACFVALGARLGLVGGGEVAFAPSKEVLVTGAAGRTGRLVVQQLLAEEGFEARALVRSEQSRKGLLKFAPTLKPEKVFLGDVLEPSTLAPALAGCFALVIVTSAVPRIRLFSLVKTLFGSLVGKKVPPKFRWKADLKPEQADWEGQKSQVDAALAAGVSRIIVVGSMGGTQPDNFLNSIGEGEGDKILLWKRKAEVYMIERCKDSATSYTIVHPGGLTDTPAGKRQLVAGLDDELLKRKVRSIPRAEVAGICVQALTCPEAEDRSFDVCANSPDDGKPPAAASLAELLGPLEGGNCDYSLNPPP